MNTITSSTVTAAHSRSPRRRNKWLVWIRRVLLFVVALIGALAMVGATYQAIMDRADRRRYPPPGQLVDVGSSSMHIHCTGETEPGTPTVVLETLSGGTSLTWAWVQPEVARTTRVCSYDRAGRGWSEPVKTGRDAYQTAGDLHTLLGKAGVPGPYVLVGHSLGGLYTRTYAELYPEEVAGIVLLDASHPEQYVRYPELGASSASYTQQLAWFPWLARLGVFRLYFAMGGEIDFADLPPRERDALKAIWSSPRYFISQRQESSIAPAVYERAQQLGSLGSIPLLVVSALNDQPPGWAGLQQDLVTLSSNSAQRIVDGATHVSLTFDPDHAHATSAAILDIVEAARTGQPVTR